MYTFNSLHYKNRYKISEYLLQTSFSGILKVIKILIIPLPCGVLKYSYFYIREKQQLKNTL
jgi:hypothetical protein